MQNKEVIYIDMDNVLVDFESGINRLIPEDREKYKDNFDNCPGIFSKMDPMPGAVEAFEKLSKKFNVYILSTAPWENPSAWSDKLLWVKKHLGPLAHKRLNLSHNKHLFTGSYIIDDRRANGVDKFDGIHIHFGTERFPNWKSVISYFILDHKSTIQVDDTQNI